MFTLGTTQILVGSIIEVLIFIVIFSAGYGIGKSVRHSTEQAKLENILGRALTLMRGLRTSVKELKSDVTDVKQELTLRSLCPECSKLHVSNSFQDN